MKLEDARRKIEERRDLNAFDLPRQRDPRRPGGRRQGPGRRAGDGHHRGGVLLPEPRPRSTPSVGEIRPLRLRRRGQGQPPRVGVRDHQQQPSLPTCPPDPTTRPAFPGGSSDGSAVAVVAGMCGLGGRLRPAARSGVQRGSAVTGFEANPRHATTGGSVPLSRCSTRSARWAPTWLGRAGCG